MGYRYEQVLAYEVARELANLHIADCSALIGDEQERTAPDQARVEQMHEKMTALVIEQRKLDMTDDAAVSTFIRKYRREPYRAGTASS